MTNLGGTNKGEESWNLCQPILYFAQRFLAVQTINYKVVFFFHYLAFIIWLFVMFCTNLICCANFKKTSTILNKLIKFNLKMQRRVRRYNICRQPVPFVNNSVAKLQFTNVNIQCKLLWLWTDYFLEPPREGLPERPPLPCLATPLMKWAVF